jgi:hypothetical protein
MGESVMASRTLSPYSRSGVSSQLSEAASFPEIRKRLAPQYRHLPTEYIEQIIEQNFGEGVSPDDVESFFGDIGNAVKSVGSVVKSALPAVLPVAGTVVGTALGGPVGGALGGTLGSTLGGAIAPSPKPGSAPLPKPAAAPKPGIVGTMVSAVGNKAATGGNPSAAQLLQTLFNPKVIQGLQSMALGQAGKQTISVAGNQVPISAFTNLLGSLLTQATEEHHRIQASSGESVGPYLIHAEGYPTVDFNSPEQRAGVLLNLLQQESLNQWQQPGKAQQRYSQMQRAQEDIDHYYDMLDLASLHEDLEEWEIH